MNTFKKLSFLAALLASLSTQLQAQTPAWQNVSSNYKHVEKGEGRKMVVTVANIKTGVSLERLTLISGEGNTGKKVAGAAMALGASLLGAKGDFASREPIEEHMKQEDAEKIAAEALELLMAKLTAAGIDVQGPKVVIDAPMYAAVKGESKTMQKTESQDGGIFKKSFYYGIYQTPVAGMKYRETGVFDALNTELFSGAMQAANTSAALDINMGFVNDKSTFSVTGLTIMVYGVVKGGSKAIPFYIASLKNMGDFSVASGGKDTLAYWTALKPKVEVLFEDVSKRIVAAYAQE